MNRYISIFQFDVDRDGIDDILLISSDAEFLFFKNDGSSISNYTYEVRYKCYIQCQIQYRYTGGEMFLILEMPETHLILRALIEYYNMYHLFMSDL